MANAVQQGLNILQVGAFRVPFLFAQFSSGLMVGELAFRATRAALGVFGVDGTAGVSKFIYDNTPVMVGKVMRPYQKWENKDLVMYGLAAAIIGVLGCELVAYVFGKAPPIYNQVLTYMGNIRVSNDHHPLVQMAIDRFRG